MTDNRALLLNTVSRTPLIRGTGAAIRSGIDDRLDHGERTSLHNSLSILYDEKKYLSIKNYIAAWLLLAYKKGLSF